MRWAPCVALSFWAPPSHVSIKIKARVYPSITSTLYAKFGSGCLRVPSRPSRDSRQSRARRIPGAGLRLRHAYTGIPCSPSITRKCIRSNWSTSKKILESNSHQTKRAVHLDGPFQLYLNQIIERFVHAQSSARYHW